MKEPDRDTIYHGVLLACGLPPKPIDYSRERNIKYHGYSQAYNRWMHITDYMVFTAMRNWINLVTRPVYERQQLWLEERNKFRAWISVMQTKQKLGEEYEIAGSD
jgi:hypothetical protein